MVIKHHVNLSKHKKKTDQNIHVLNRILKRDEIFFKNDKSTTVNETQSVD